MQIKTMFSYIFIITILWVGFILALSFLEAPLKFQAPSVSVPIGLEIGHLVFHALNRIEWFFAILILINLFVGQTTSQTMLTTIAVIILLNVQTLLLYGPLDQRTLAIINGRSVGEAPYHIYYIALEVIKLIGLIFLVYFQLQDFKSVLLTQTGDG